MSLAPNIRQLYDRVWDEADYVVPPAENGAFFVTTNVVITPNQTWGHCPEVSSVPAKVFLSHAVKWIFDKMANIWIKIEDIDIAYITMNLNSEFYSLGNLFQSIPIFWRVLWIIRDSDTILIHIFSFCCQDPVSVPESLCEVEDWNTNTSSSCNNDNYDSNKSECPPLHSPILVYTPLSLRRSRAHHRAVCALWPAPPAGPGRYRVRDPELVPHRGRQTCQRCKIRWLVGKSSA